MNFKVLTGISKVQERWHIIGKIKASSTYGKIIEKSYVLQLNLNIYSYRLC